MYFVYVLLCSSRNGERKFYIGSTSDLRKRVIKHKTKSVGATRNFDKIELIYYEACLNKTDAIKRERQLKTGFGRGYLKRRLINYLKEK